MDDLTLAHRELVEPRREVPRVFLRKLCQYLGYEANDVSTIYIDPHGIELVVYKRNAEGKVYLCDCGDHIECGDHIATTTHDIRISDE